MSSFPQHEQNIRDLESMGLDISECVEDGEVTLESWGYDDLVYLITDIIRAIKAEELQ